MKGLLRMPTMGQIHFKFIANKMKHCIFVFCTSTKYNIQEFY